MPHKFFLYFLILIFNLQSLNASHHWSAEARGYSREYYFPYFNRYVSTLRGVCDGIDISYKKIAKLKNIKLSEYQFKVDGLEQKIPVKMALQVNKLGKPLVKPLMVVLPGAFTNLKSQQTRMLIYRFFHSRLSCLSAFQNPWGTQYIKLKSEKLVGDIVHEGKTLYQAIRAGVEKLDKKNIAKMSVSGVSYGGFLSVMMGRLRRPS